MESSWPRDQTHVPLTDKQILNLWTTREVNAFLSNGFENIYVLKTYTHLFLNIFVCIIFYTIIFVQILFFITSLFLQLMYLSYNHVITLKQTRFQEALLIIFHYKF